MTLKTTAGNHGEAAKGRGATINPEGRFERVQREAYEDGWFQEPPILGRARFAHGRASYRAPRTRAFAWSNASAAGSGT